MAALLPDRELRLNIVRLRSLRPDDFNAVIESLDAEQRRRVLALLAELDGQADALAQSQAEVIADPVLLPADLSPWLAARVNGRGESGEETADHFTLTPHAQAALRRCAAALVPQPPQKVASPSLLERMWQRFA